MKMIGLIRCTIIVIIRALWRGQAKIIVKIRRPLYLKSVNGIMRPSSSTICDTLTNWMDVNRVAVAIHRSIATWWMVWIHRKKFVTFIYQSRIIVQAHNLMNICLNHGHRYDQLYVHHDTNLLNVRYLYARTHALCATFYSFINFMFISGIVYQLNLFIYKIIL